MKAIKPQYLLLWTSRRELWMGLTTAPLDARDMELTHVRQCIRFSGTHKGVLGLCVVGPDDQCRVSPPVARMFIREIDWACEVQPSALAGWERQPWL